MRYIISLALTILPIAALPMTALAEVPKVVTDIPPVHALASQVMGALGTPVLLLEKGADEHDFQLRPSQMQSIADADTIIWIGPELTPWLERAMTGSTATSLALLDSAGTDVQPYEPGTKEEGHDDAAEGHDHGGEDPHAWMNPDNASVWLDLIAAQLALQDPDNAAAYTANATAAKAGIAAMDAEIAASLASVQPRAFVTFHAAYGYFTTHYGLTNAASLALGDASAPGAARLTALQADLLAGNFICAFPEVQHDPALLIQVMQGSAVKLGAALDPVGSSLDAGPDAYDVLMRNIAKSLTDCLNG